MTIAERLACRQLDGGELLAAASCEQRTGDDDPNHVRACSKARATRAAWKAAELRSAPVNWVGAASAPSPRNPTPHHRDGTANKPEHHGRCVGRAGSVTNIVRQPMLETISS